MPLLAFRKNGRPRHASGNLLNRIAALLLIACVPCLSVFEISKAQSAEKPRAPNIVLIMADDK